METAEGGSLATYFGKESVGELRTLGKEMWREILSTPHGQCLDEKKILILSVVMLQQ